MPSVSANAPVSRADFVIQLEQIAKLPQVQGGPVYADVSPKERLFPALQALAPYLNPRPLCMSCMFTRNFFPQAPMSRGQAALAAVRILESAKKLAQLNAAEVSAIRNRASDAKGWPPLAVPYFTLAIKNGILPLNADRSFGPSANLTRAADAVLLAKVKQFLTGS